MTSPRRLVLASTSPYRRDLFARLGLPFEVAAPDFEESELKKTGLAPGALALALARAKARSLAARFPDALAIGADQVAEVGGERLGKPGSEEAARAQLARLEGREHRLYTAVAVHDAASGRTADALDVHRVLLRSLSAAEIADYVARDRPLDCAGSYRIESLGIALMERVSGDDFTAVIGLPLTRVVALLGEFGVRTLGSGVCART
jgi:septum formation protein